VEVQANPLQGVTVASGIVTSVFVVGALYFASELLIPLALAVLISFILSPLIVGLRRLGVRRGAAAFIVVTVSFTAILAAGTIGAAQIVQLADSLPQYRSNLEEKVLTLRSTLFSRGALSQAADMIGNLSREFAADGAAQPSGAREPVPVEIQTPRPDALQVISNFLSPLVSPLVTAALVVIFVIFFLVQREELRDRVIRILGTKTLHRTTEAMSEAARRLSRYLFLFTLLSAAYGAAVGIALWFIGIPSAWLWGILAMLMRYVPFVGSFIAAIFPVALAAAVDPGWTLVLLTALIYLVGETLMGNFVEPVVLGQRVGLSPVAILVAATFWTWLWGPIGLILATPLTLCLVILGQYMRPLEFLYVMLGDQSPLTPPETAYQRLIAGDPDEVLDQAEEQLKETSLVKYYDEVILPALELADRDVRSGDLSSDRQLLLVDGVRELTDGLGDQNRDTTEPSSVAQDSVAASQDEAVSQEARPVLRPEWRAIDNPVLCIGGGGPVNHAAAALLAHALGGAGLGSILPSAYGFAGLSEALAQSSQVKLVCVCMVGTGRAGLARFLVRRIRRAFLGAKILIGYWGAPANASTASQIKAGSGADLIAATLAEAVALCITEAYEDSVPARSERAQKVASKQDEETLAVPLTNAAASA
jgi:predicted PurR-regulated permease PerM